MHVQSWINAGYLEYTTTTVCRGQPDVEDLGGVLGHQLLVLLPQGVHTVDHLLHKLNLQQDQSVKVRDQNYSTEAIQGHEINATKKN